ncbi:hypothetical protein BV25DRAFT_1915794 [Artomyces pyxidatus]|uniref:Uncharacterized protein n=1 Tax=Artomyces pyxidatus TaxID=48021 RepID=A0ACB8T1S8_9AGAM|nr:hypothetical protein BV25DRAFT_1915794 [Artomyces pyxidatus]
MSIPWKSTTSEYGWPFELVVPNKSQSPQKPNSVQEPQHIDVPGVIERVFQLFHDHSSLIRGFSTFLPDGYSLDVDASSQMFVTITPWGTYRRSINEIMPGLPLPPPKEESNPSRTTDSGHSMMSDPAQRVLATGATDQVAAVCSREFGGF